MAINIVNKKKILREKKIADIPVIRNKQNIDLDYDLITDTPVAKG